MHLLTAAYGTKADIGRSGFLKRKLIAAPHFADHKSLM
jgi:hypothetical protein